MRSDSRGSFTVEAAFAVPVFVFAITAFVLLFKMLLMQIQLQEAMNEASKEMSQLAYLNEAVDTKITKKTIAFPKIVAGRYEIERFFTEKNRYNVLLNSPIHYEENPFGDTDSKREEEIDLIANYKLRIPLPLFNLQKFAITQRVKGRKFVGSQDLLCLKRGEDEGEQNKRYVYITETGTVYHLTLECSSLKLKIIQCSKDEVATRRNQSGGKYKKCEKCCSQDIELSSVYICEDGDRFHSILECSGLKRTIHRVSFDEVIEKMRACYRCGTEN